MANETQPVPLHVKNEHGQKRKTQSFFRYHLSLITVQIDLIGGDSTQKRIARELLFQADREITKILDEFFGPEFSG